MHKCRNHEKSPVRKDPQSDQPGAPKTVLFRTTSEVGEGVPNSGGRGLVQGKELSKRGDRTGKNKTKWTKEERCLVWECFVRSGGKGSYGYIKRLMEFWEERALSKRSQASVLAQIKSIEKGGLLSEYEKGEIERLVRSEGEPAGQDNSVNNVYNETTQDDDLAVDDVDIDFTVFSKSSQCHSVESFVGKESDIGDDFWDHEDDFEPEVQVERLNVFEKGDVVRITNEEENKIIFRIHQILNSNECREIPSLKNIDKCLVMKEVSIVNSLLRNFVAIGIPDITKANRLLYAGSYIVCERLGLLKEKGEKLKSKKPWWQRRLEGSIQQWRKDLGRVNEIKNGKTLKRKTLDELERRYQITERG
eukprot:TCONS_00040429-protein